ncbi:DUF5691 domain-containing protein [Micromonospora sp. NPDC003197]
MPIERWTTEQIRALAPDASSMTTAHRLSGAAKWTATGLSDGVLWGLCQGSGKNPYQACVDLSEPAYRCSCPSRKFPCKHALGLLLLWSGSDVAEQIAPDWVDEWRESRAARAAKVSARRAAAADGPVDEAAARKRAEQRTGRITAGLAELDQWLLDQVGQGLADAAQVDSKAYQKMAARLVDAQAPTVAGVVRRLGDIPGVGTYWTDRLLGELAMLRLLVTSHDRIGELPDDLAATVRARIGVPVSTDEVLAGTPLRDHWQVLGQIDEDEERLTVRRTWLRGVNSGRFALVLAFSAPGQALPADLVPGTMLDAELCWYPGGLPLRALVARRHGQVEPMGSPAGASPVREALAGWSAALAADPWCERVPMLLADVVPSSDGHLVDCVGDALPLHPGDEDPWWLLAATGGQPVTVIGEYNPTGFRPLAAWPQDRYLAAVPGAGPSRPTPQLPPELVATALVGTKRRPDLPASVAVDGHRLNSSGTSAHASGPGTQSSGPAEPAAALLETAAVALTYRRAGVTVVGGRVPVVTALEETRPVVPEAAARRLNGLMTGIHRDDDGNELPDDPIADWLRYAADRGYRVPAELVPKVLEFGRPRGELHSVISAVTGQRGNWLAAQSARWQYLPAEAEAVPAAADPGLWGTGSREERLDHLCAVRRVDPAAGLDLLASTFDTEPPKDRAEFVEALADGLSLADEELLERALRDRHKKVRITAANLLATLPESAWCGRMVQRALPCVRLEPDETGQDQLVVTPPTEADAGLRRDTTQTVPTDKAGLRSWLFEEVVAGTPLDAWTSAFGRPAEAILQLPVADDWGSTLYKGMARAVLAQRNPAWAVALVERLAGSEDRQLRFHLHHYTIEKLYEVLPPAELAKRIAHGLRSEPERAQDLVSMLPTPWPDEVADAMLVALETLAHSDRHSWYIRNLCRQAGAAMPVTYDEPVTALAKTLAADHPDRGGASNLTQLAANLTYRRKMYEELP